MYQFACTFGLSTTHHNINIGQLAWEPYHNYTVLWQKCSTSVLGHHSAISKFLQSCSNIRRMTCFWWKLTHNSTIHTRRLSLKESCLEMNVKHVPTFAGCQVAPHPESGSCGRRRIGLLIFLLFVLETSQYPSGLCLEEVTLFLRLDGEHPSSCHIISRLNLPHGNKITNLVLNSGFVF